MVLKEISSVCVIYMLQADLGFKDGGTFWFYLASTTTSESFRICVCPLHFFGLSVSLSSLLRHFEKKKQKRVVGYS